VANKYSIFEFLHQLGVYFNSKYDFHNHTLFDVYDALNYFILENYKEDKNLQQLMTIDYQLNYKVKPQQRYLPEIDKSLKSELILNHKLDHHQYRFVIMECDHECKSYLKNIDTNKYLVVQYSGTDKPSYFGIN
jgi:hypothetical protein